MTTEERLMELEVRIARQEDTIDALNTTIYQQQKKIDELTALCTGLARHIKEIRAAASDAGPAHEKPPHY